MNLAANLEKMPKPENTLYMALVKNRQDDDFGSSDKKLIEILNKCDTNSKSYSIINGAGYGEIGGKKAVVINYQIKNFDGLKSCMIYLERDVGENQKSRK